jgi:putative transposase
LAIENDPGKASERAKRNTELHPEGKRVWKENLEVYDAGKLRQAMKQEKFYIARCTVERLVRDVGMKAVRRDKKLKTAWPFKALARPWTE